MTTKGTKVNVHVLDFFAERPDSSDKTKSYSHGNIVSEIVHHFGNGMVKAVSRNLSDVYGDHKITESVRLEKEAGLHERVISFLDSLDKEAIVNMSFRFLADDDSVKDAIFRFLSRGNILFMALGNEGDDVSTRQSTLAGIVDYILRNARGDQTILRSFRLVGNLSVDPVLEVTKGDEDSYIAAMSPESISQKPGTSTRRADLAAHLQSMASVASGGFHSKVYNTYFDGTSSATPAHAGAVGAAIAILMGKCLPWEDASVIALDLLSTTLEKTYKALQWRFNQEGIALEGQSELPLPRAVFGEGVLNYEAYLTAVISYVPEAAPQPEPEPVLAVPLPADAPGEKFYGPDLHTHSVTSGSHSSHTHAVATGPWTPFESAVTSKPAASIFLPSRDPLADILQDFKRISEAEERERAILESEAAETRKMSAEEERARAIAAAEMARKLIEERKAQAAETRKMAAEDRKSGAVDSDSDSDDDHGIIPQEMGNRILTQDSLKRLAAQRVPRSPA